MAKSLIQDPAFKERHRRNKEDFTRSRKLPFPLVLLFILQKSLKSLQLSLNEFFGKRTDFLSTVTDSALSQARSKLLFSAFIELNRKAVVEPYYADDNFRKFRGFRVLGIDGSKIILPDTPEIREYFGCKVITNGRDDTVIGEYPFATASVLYDVLNNIPIDSQLDKSDSYEVDLAIEHLQYTTSNDLLILDRNYPSYRFLATLAQMNRNFIVRCSGSSFKEARQMLKQQGPDSQIVTLKPHHSKVKEIEVLGLPEQITVRFVRVMLSTGEPEVLVTSLLDEVEFPNIVFKELYHFRWGLETFYGTAKGRLNLENFSGKTIQAVKQDFYATIFISALESVITEDAQQQLDQKQTTTENKHPQQVNKAVSFNAIKANVLQLLYSDEEPHNILEKLTRLFLTKPICNNKNRDVPRKKSSARILYNYHRRRKKICF